ncbi:MAG: ATP-dependent DNA ligase [Acidimicrobiales bacterium]
MSLPVEPPVSPMLAKAAKAVPEGPNWQYEPKWDGFRCIVFRDGDEVVLGSRNTKPLTRYFPELLDPIREQLADGVVIDGELVVAGPDGLDFDALQQRIHPAESRVNRLAAETPASFVGFDLLAADGRDWREDQLSARWERLVELMGAVRPPLHLSPSTSDPDVARDWFTRFEGAGLDGVLAKRLDTPYREGERTHVKVKHSRTADCVVAGFRWHKSGGIVGSLLLGLYDADGDLHHIGVAAAFTMKKRAELVDLLAPYRDNSLADHPWESWAEAAAGQRLPGAVSRWNSKKDLSWEPVRVELVCEVSYDQLQGSRFRHAGQFVRWRPDRDPSSCTYQQLDVVAPAELAQVFGA